MKIKLAALAAVNAAYAGDSREVVPASDVEWEQLNPARGDKSDRQGRFGAIART